MKLLDKKTATDGTKLVIFMLVTIMATGLLVIVIGNISFQGTQDYKAVFTDATGVVKGDDVRIAGVKVGTVKDIEVVDGDDSDRHPSKMAEVSFTVEEGTELTQSTYAALRYRNLVGQRYVSLTPGRGRARACSSRGRPSPTARTEDALDLTELFNGFKPLFRALSPDDVNKLSYEVIQVFQGEGGTLEGLLAEHRVGDRHPRRPRRDHRPAARQPRLRARPRGRPRHPALGADLRTSAQLVAGPQGRPAGDPRLLRPDHPALGRDRRPGQGRAPAVRRGHQAAAPPDQEHRRQQAASSTGPCRCCRSSSTRSAAPPPTARSSTSTSATSRAWSACPASRPSTSACPTNHRRREVQPRMKPFRERNPVIIGARQPRRDRRCCCWPPSAPRTCR